MVSYKWNKVFTHYNILIDFHCLIAGTVVSIVVAYLGLYALSWLSLPYYISIRFEKNYLILTIIMTFICYLDDPSYWISHL